MFSCNKQEKVYDYDISPVDIDKVRITGGMWAELVARNREVTLPYAFKKCEETNRIENFARAAGITEGPHEGERYNDTDVYKIIEGAAYSLMQKPDAKLEQYVDSLVSLIAAAQEPDGYIFTSRTIDATKPAPGAGRERWIDVWVSHELYNAGHLDEAAVAYYKATGKRELLDVALKNADLIYDEFGWDKRKSAPGHQEIEIGLVKLFEVTGEKRYLDLAQFFIDVRGYPQEHLKHEPGTRFAVYNDLEYLQQHKPVLEQEKATGHAVRATYMYSGLTDIAVKKGLAEYLEASERLWNNVVNTKIYITGGVGAQHRGEAFGPDYYLPNASAYNETCAAIGNVFWNERLFRATGDSKYVDVLERSLYNGLISGLGYDGKTFFYPNPLESDGDYQRSPWFGVACCPGNLVRFISQVNSYIYAHTDEAVYINLFIPSEAEISLAQGNISIIQETDYPWSGNVKLTVTVENTVDFDLKIRIPQWLKESPLAGDLYSYTDSSSMQPVLKSGNEPLDYTEEKGYMVISRKWHGDENITVGFPMEIRKVVANNRVEENRGKIAFERGPVVYCFEEADNGKILNNKVIGESSQEFSFNPDLLGGSGLINVNAVDSTGTPVRLTGIPYFRWANRGKGEMAVWMEIK